MDLKKVKIGILGGGAMGEAIIRGILKAKLFSLQQVFVSDTTEQRLKYLKDTYKIKTYTDNKKLVIDSANIIIAVKPQVLPTVMQECASCADKNKLFISVAAGVKTAAISSLLSGSGRIIRAMPNSEAPFPGKEASAKAATAGGLVGASVANGGAPVAFGLVG